MQRRGEGSVPQKHVTLARHSLILRGVTSTSVFPLLALAWAVRGCRAPGQYGGPIPIDTVGLASRLQARCEANGGTGSQERCRARLTDADADASDDDANDRLPHQQ